VHGRLGGISPPCAKWRHFASSSPYVVVLARSFVTGVAMLRLRRRRRREIAGKNFNRCAVVYPRRLYRSACMGRIFKSVCLSVCHCLSVCPQHNSKTNDPKVFKLGVGNDLCRRINAHTVNAQYLPNGKAYEATKFKLGTQTRISDKRRDLQGERSRSQGHVIRLTGVGR